MLILRRTALGTFAAGIVLFAIGLVAVFGRSGGAPETDFDDISEVTTPTSVRRATRTPTIGPTATGTPAPPTPTPTPFGGAVARLQLEALGVDSPIEEVALDANNQMETPDDPHNTGWYYIYSRPGWGGNAVFSAHVDYWPNIKGPFNRLDETELGDRVHVVMANGTRYVYEVIALDRYEAETMPTGDIITPPRRPPGEEWITLITCGGDFVRQSEQGWGEYLHRDVVVARLVETIEA